MNQNTSLTLDCYNIHKINTVAFLGEFFTIED